MMRSARFAVSFASLSFLAALVSPAPVSPSGLRGADPPSGGADAWFVIYPPESGGQVSVAIECIQAGIQGWAYGLCHDLSAARLRRFELTPELRVINHGAPPDFVTLDEVDPRANEGRAGLVQAIVLAYYEPLVIPVRSGGFPVLDAEYEILGGATSTVSICSGLKGRGQPVQAVLTLRGQSIIPSKPAQATLTPLAQDAWFDLAPPVSDGSLKLSIDSNSAAVEGWSVGVCHDPSAAVLERFSLTDELKTFLAGVPQAFEVTEQGADPLRAGVVHAVALTDPARTVTLPARAGGFPILDLEYSATSETSVYACGGLVGSGQPVSLILTVGGASRVPSKLAGATLIPRTPASQLAFRTVPDESSEIITVTISTGSLLAQGWSFALCNSVTAAEVLEYRTSPELGSLVDGEAPGFVSNQLVPAGPYTALTQQVILGSVMEPLSLGPFSDLPVLNIRYRVKQTHEVLKFCDRDPLGTVTFENKVIVDGIAYIPWTRKGSRLVSGALGTSFIRGDADLNRAVQLTDAVYILMALFLGGEPLPCLDAADANDVGRVDISDPIFILTYLFLGGPQPPPPFPEPGQDLSPETALGCERGL